VIISFSRRTLLRVFSWLVSYRTEYIFLAQCHDMKRAVGNRHKMVKRSTSRYPERENLRQSVSYIWNNYTRNPKESLATSKGYYSLFSGQT